METPLTPLRKAWLAYEVADHSAKWRPDNKELAEARDRAWQRYEQVLIDTARKA